MKKLLLIILSIGLFGCSTKYKFTEYKYIKEIDMDKISFYSLPLFDIHCDKITKGEIKITDSKTIKKLSKLIYNLERDPLNRGVDDARVKLWIRYEHRADIVCMNASITEINGVSYFTTEELCSFIECIPPNTEWKDIE